MISKEHRYDFSIKAKEDRAKFIEDKLGYILNLPPHMLMGYLNNSRKVEYKTDRIPNMIDTYTSYFLRANDIESSRKTEYSYYIDRHEEMLRKKNRILFKQSESFEGSQKKEWEEGLTHEETYSRDDVANLDDLDTEVMKYAIRKDEMSLNDYKKLLSDSGAILYKNNDREFKDMIEQIVFNCAMSAQDEKDVEILREYVQGDTLRGISNKIGVSKNTVDRRINKMLDWVGQK